MYGKVGQGREKYHPDDELLSYYRVKNHIWTLTGISPLRYDMLPNGYVAYVGADASREVCADTACVLF